MRRAFVSALGGLALTGVLLAAPASSGNGIKMRTAPGACIPVCPGDREPAWSPDGKRIAFIRRTRQDIRRSVARAIYTVPAGGGAAQRVTAPSRQRVPDAIAWSPDSTRLAYRTTNGENYVVPAAGGTPVPIRPPPNTAPGVYFRDSLPVWSPDGRWLAFGRLSADRFARPWCCQVWIAAADGSSARSFGGAAPAEWLTAPAWSPDGRIAFVTGPRTGDGIAPDFSRSEIWVSNPDGSGRRRLVGDVSDYGFSGLTWSADGSRLAYVAHNSTSLSLDWVSSDGASSGGVGLINNENASMRCCAFSPDATRAVYADVGADGGAEVRLVQWPTIPRRVADGISSQSWPRLTTASWSPDGQRVAYVSDGDCPTELAVFTARITTRLTGTDRRRLTRPCRIAGSHGDNKLRGTAFTDALYGRGGNDRLYAAGRPDFLQGGFGRDVLFGGPGDDRLYGGPGRDSLSGGPGWDAIYSRDEAADLVRCGSGNDSVWADARDRVARDCELTVRK